MSIRFGVISDIHGNLEGLQAVLAKLHRLEISEIICLGDVVGYGADPEACWAEVKRTCSLVLEGNHEAILTGKVDDSHCSALGRQSAVWTKAHVSPAVCREFAALPFRGEQYGAVFYHSSPKDDNSWPYLNRLEQITEAFSCEKAPLVFYGHTHRPRITVINAATGAVERDELIQRTSQFTVDIRTQRCYLNPGSAGQQRDTHTDVSFAVCNLINSTFKIEVFRISYCRFRCYKKIVHDGCGMTAATYLIREKERRRWFELLDHWGRRIRWRTFD